MDSVSFKVEGLDKLVAQMGQFIEPNGIDLAVKKAALPIVEKLQSDYRVKHGQSKSAIEKKLTLELANSIQAFPRKRKSPTDTFFTYYIGPKYAGKGETGGGNAAHLLEYGTVQRFRANVSKGGVKMRSGVYGAKHSTGKSPAFGIIRKVVATSKDSVLNNMGNYVVAYIAARAKQLGFK